MIRPATQADCLAINAIYNHHVLAGTATYQEETDTLEQREVWFRLHGAKHPVFVATDSQGRVIGWASLSPFHARSAYRHTVENSIYLQPEFQRQGIGSALLEKLIEKARSLGHRQIVALISSDQPGSIRLHEKFRFRRVGRLEDVGLKFGRWLSVEYWQFTL